MNRFNSLRLLLSMLLVAVSCAAASALTAEEAFVKAPHKVFPLLDRNARLDMIDYFKVGMAKPTGNSLDGSSLITALDPSSLTVSITEASDAQIAVLPAGSDTIVAVITTIKTPTPDSKLTVYSSDWKRTLTSSVFSKPELRDWLTPEGRKNIDDVEIMVPFLLIDYTFDSANGTLTLTNRTREFLSDDVYSIVKPYLVETLTYRWNGKRFASVK